MCCELIPFTSLSTSLQSTRMMALFRLALFGIAISCLCYGFPALNEPAAHEGFDTVGEEGDYFEGDIVLGPDEDPNDVRSGIVAKSRRWPNAVLYYTLDDAITNEQVEKIKYAFLEIQVTTCIQFVERSRQKAYVNIKKPDSGCNSALGRTGGRQVVNLADGCYAHGTIMHEMIHALGFMHEQNRHDRDDYVEIAWDNIKPGREANFDKLPESTHTTFGLPYDYLSVMHYRSGTFAINNTLPTIIVKNGSPIGNRVFLSEYDIAKLRAMYECGTPEQFKSFREQSHHLHIVFKSSSK